jgi:hypothetical protein
MALCTFVQGCAAQRNAVVNGATVANLGCFTNHDAHPVIKKYSLAQLGTWVNFNARDPA